MSLLIGEVLLLGAPARLSERDLNRAGLPHLKPVMQPVQAAGLMIVVLVVPDIDSPGS